MNKKRYYIIGAFLVILLSIFVSVRTNSYVNNNIHLSAVMQSVYSNTFNQVIYIMAISIYAMALLFCFNRFIDKGIIVVMSPLVGAMLWAVYSVIILCIGIPYTAFTMGAFALIVLVVCIIITKPDFKDIDYKSLSVVLLCYVAVSFLVTILDCMVFSEDSYTYVVLGKTLARNEYMDGNMIAVYSARALVTASLFSPSEFFGFDYANGFYAFTGISFSASLSYFIYKEINSSLGKKKSLIICLAILCSLITTNAFVMITIFYPISNSISTITLFMTLYFAYIAKKGDARLLYVSLFFIICFLWTRTENALIVLVLVFLFSNMGFKKKQIINYIIVCTLALLFWYIKFFALAGIGYDEGKFLTISRASLVVGAYACLIIYLIVLDRVPFYKKIKDKLDYLPFVGIGLVIASFVYFDFAKLSKNIGVVFVNISVTGAWCLGFLGLMIAMALYYLIVKKVDIFDKALLLNVFMLIFIFLFRVTDLRFGLGDSGNRMLCQLVPIAYFMIGTRLLPQLIEKQDINN